MDYFTYITGIATLTGFVLQVFDILPDYKLYRQKLLYFSFGLFLGSLFTAFDSSSIQFTFKLSGHVLLVALISSIIFWLLYIAYKTHRDEFFSVSAIGFSNINIRLIC